MQEIKLDMSFDRYHIDDVYRRNMYKDWRFYEIISHNGELRIDYIKPYKFFVVTNDNKHIGTLAANGVSLYEASKGSISDLIADLLRKKVIKERNKDFADLILTIMRWTDAYEAFPSLEKKLLACKIPEKYKKIQQDTLYRSIILRDNNLDDIEERSIKLRPRICTSWTTDLDVATDGFGPNNYNYTGVQIVIKIPVAQADVVINLGHPDFEVINSYSSECEVIVRGNGIDAVTNDNIVQTNYE